MKSLCFLILSYSLRLERESEREMKWDGYQKEAVTVTAMVAAEFSSVGLNIIFKAASAKGMSNYVFILYTYVSTVLCLLPFAFFHGRSLDFPSDKLSFFFILLFLAVNGVSSQICGYKGLEFSSPTLSSVISNLMPAFTFIFAVLFRMEKVKWKSSSTIAKITGTIVSMIGALVAVLYKVPILLSHPSSSSPKLHLHHQPLLSSLGTHWVLGGFLFTIQYLLYALWYIFQTKAIKMYPSEPRVLFLYYTCALIVATPVCLLAETNSKAWTLQTDLALPSIIYSGFMGQSFTAIIHQWGLRNKGPVYVSSFRPLSIVIAAAMGFIFLSDALHLGSIIGAVIISMGFYTLLWGKAKEDEINQKQCGFGNMESSASYPLLQPQTHNGP